VPIAVKLSKKFYDRLGEDIVNELVEWFNQMDVTYRSDLRELNETNWLRFDAKLEQRIAEVRSELQAFKAEIRGDLKELKADLIKWMFLFWAGTAFAGLLFRTFGWTN
jgi:hypothetical protein